MRKINDLYDHLFRISKSGVDLFVLRLFSLVLLLAGEACSTLKIQEINYIDREMVNAPLIKPGYELNNLRIDLIRQTRFVLNDSTLETENEPYGPVGFDLGNGIFYDLNKNFCITIDHLLGFSADRNFELVFAKNPDKRPASSGFLFSNDTLYRTRNSGRKFRYVYNLIVHGDSTTYMKNDFMRFALVHTDSSLVYWRKKKTGGRLIRQAKDRYIVYKGKDRSIYWMDGDAVFLDKDYILRRERDQKSITIARQKKRRDKILFTIIMAGNKIFIYRPDHTGFIIERQENSLLIHRGNRVIAAYELLSTSF